MNSTSQKPDTTRKLTLKKAKLAELSSAELGSVVGGGSGGLSRTCLENRDERRP